ncbi:MAG: hypothetical protein L3J98_12725 [Gammaproteobacteria bacterium]|nr:hypothetical protein [Gammaproteobacteria bacterium]MCF6261001.1 hypothetical protein [Gammaproteobacteria bacterium]
MGGFDVEQARTAFGIPDDVELMVVIAVGYHGAMDALHKDFQEMENATWERKPLGNGFFAGQWGWPVSD